MKSVGVLAGPRKGHTTDKLIDAVLQGLKAGGSEIDKVSVYDMDIAPCSGCGACQDQGKCVIDDDERALLRLMGESDVVVFGSPVYWSNISSEAKKIMDRGIEFFTMEKTGPVRKEARPRHVVLVTSCGAPFPLSHLFGVIPGAFRAMKAFFGCTSARVHKLYSAGMMDYDKAEPSEGLLRRARKMGESLAHRNV